MHMLIIEAVIIALIYVLGLGSGLYLHKRASIDYKQRWLESLQIIKQEKLLSEKIEAIEPPPELPQRLKGKPFVPSYGKEYFKYLSGPERRDMELQRLELGLEPKDSMGGTPSEFWVTVRKAQLEAGWEHHDGGYYRVREPNKTIKNKYSA